MGACISWWRDGRTGLLMATSPRNWARLLPVSGLFCFGTWLTLSAVTYLAPVFVKVLFQLKLPVTVLLSSLLLKRRYSILQVQALMNVFLAVTAFTALRVGCVSSFAPRECGGLALVSLGLLCVAGAVACNVLASLLAERALKNEGGAASAPVHVTVANLKAGEALVAFALMSLVPGAPLPLSTLLRSPSSAFTGFGTAAWLLSASLIADGWMSALVVKELSSVVKALSKCLSLIVLYLISLGILQTEVFSLPQFILAVLVASGTQQFTYASLLKKKEGARIQRPLSDADF
eukprot:CAMPEP_0168357176 /NCGR_PEP_ID=MMETSP0228-20121227/450_1 /TAXON_ID=133427 /ORGANISM="Protoceratium reticulatum, Strain CCCM 535 (=CCMP 1889)" /LENGTH=290 /DNA_ID=CAMNT_0008369683 /DNA_START=65 /DNA_END=937 /DNA_ORIENTATION=-